METLISVPITLGRDRTLHIQQKQRSGGGGGGLLSALQSLASVSRSGAVHIQHVPAGAPAMLDVCGEPGTSHDVQNLLTDATQTIVVSTLGAEPVRIYLRWPKGGEEAGLERLQLRSADYPIRFEVDAPAAAQQLSLADVDFTPARELLIASSSGGVSGLLPMEDVLDVSTSSGSVGVTLLPLRGNGAHETKLAVKSNSGTVAVNARLDAAGARAHLPGRDCAISVQTSSGSMRCVLGLTRSATFKSNSGSMHLTALLADHSRDRRSDFATTSGSGSQNITVVAAPDAAAEQAGDAETGFVCKHKANSGNIRVAYPGVWEGTVDAHCNSGSIAVTGEGVEIDRDRKRVTGVKGTPLHHTDVGTGSGNISVKFGEA